MLRGDILRAVAHEKKCGHHRLLDFIGSWTVETTATEPIAPMRVTRHLERRLGEYVGRRSRDGAYVELVAEEKEALVEMPSWLRDVPASALRVVELGFNCCGQVCKVAYTLLARDMWRARGRDPPPGREMFVLFICVGADGGAKTLYMTPRFKGHASYGTVRSVDTWKNTSTSISRQ